MSIFSWHHKSNFSFFQEHSLETLFLKRWNGHYLFTYVLGWGGFVSSQRLSHGWLGSIKVRCMHTHVAQAWELAHIVSRQSIKGRLVLFPASIRVWSVIRQQINTTTSQTIFVIYCRSALYTTRIKTKNSPKRAGIVLTVSSQQSASGAIRRIYSMCVCTTHSPARVIRRAELRLDLRVTPKIPGARMHLKEMETENKIQIDVLCVCVCLLWPQQLRFGQANWRIDFSCAIYTQQHPCSKDISKYSLMVHVIRRGTNRHYVIQQQQQRNMHSVLLCISWPKNDDSLLRSDSSKPFAARALQAVCAERPTGESRRRFFFLYGYCISDLYNRIISLVRSSWHRPAAASHSHTTKRKNLFLLLSLER